MNTWTWRSWRRLGVYLGILLCLLIDPSVQAALMGTAQAWGPDAVRLVTALLAAVAALDRFRHSDWWAEMKREWRP